MVSVAVEPAAEPELVHALGVVVLIPEERQHHGRLPGLQRLGDRVVAPVGYDEVDLRQDRRLGQELGPDDVLAEVQLVVARSHADDDEVVGLCQRVDQSLHELHVGRAEAAETQIDPPAFVARKLELGVGLANAGIEPGPPRERVRPLVVRLGREDVQVEERRLMDELAGR
jgi:hypothetical protein